MTRAARQTKIVCTIGPASADEATIDRLIGAGMDVARLNMSHGDHAGHAAVLGRIRRLAAARNRPVAVLMDLQGPKIRIGELEGGGPAQLVTGDRVAIQIGARAGTARLLTTPYAGLTGDVRTGDRMLLSDGLIELRVLSTSADAVQCVVVNGGMLFERQGINLPGAGVSAPSLTEKDFADLAWGIAAGVDYIAVSFVRRPEDLEAARVRLQDAGAGIPIIAKLEKPQALDRLADILAAADGVMVARGDMGVELPAEDVPVWQKRIIAAAITAGKPVITATQMLDSMVRNPRPTRAEVTDVANAIWDGTDAVMLSAETAAGEFPVQAVMMMDRIARAAEQERAYLHIPARIQDSDIARAMAAAAREAGDTLPDEAAVVAFTRDGRTARLVSRDRPAVPVVALTDDEAVYRRLALSWGVMPVIGAPVLDLPGLLAEAQRACLATGAAGLGDTVLILGHLPPEAPGSTNFLTLHHLT